MDIQRFRWKRTWFYSSVRDRRHGRRGASMVSSSMWEADRSKPNVLNEGLGESQMFRIGPLPGDIAEVEAFCRIFRVAEQLHTSIMNILCSSETGECTVTYLSELDNFILEEKVVAGLACMSTLIQRGRQEVLSGRPTSMSSSHSTDWNVIDDKLPPLASFRAEMKKCCSMLQIALESYFELNDEHSTHIWRRLQRLRNICYDAGFPRSEGSPCHTVLPNWSAVSLYPGRHDRTSNNDEVAFWRGGQVTEEGLKWLLENGYKTIVDLRAEGIEDQQSLAAIEEVIFSGKIQLVHLPVEVGTAPSRGQVEEFSTLVSNHKNIPLYLHSQEGVWRTSAMISRWRELVLRSSSLLGSSNMPKVDGILPPHFLKQGNKGSDSKDLTRSSKSQMPTVKDSLKSLNSGNGTFSKVQDKSHGLHENVQSKSPLCFDFSKGKHGTQNMDHGQDFNKDQNPNQERGEVKVGLCQISPFEAQRLQCNVFSRREMSEIFKNRKVAPKTFIESGKKRSKASSVSINSDTMESAQNNEITGAAGRWGLSQQTIPTAASSHEKHDSTSPGVRSMEEQVHNHNSSIASDVVRNSTHGHVKEFNNYSIDTPENDSNRKISLTDGRSSSSRAETQNGNLVKLPSSSSSDNSDLEPVNGNMCASATGVVRVQSRKKAEMFLVRTDGFSCTREKVTESSLAFTHPSTQQQMLMWKTPPKTVLLLKKLGQELMDEAKQVASFLYYQEKMNVLVEPEVHDMFASLSGFGFIQTFQIQDVSDLHERVDFVACLGGDGVILHASNLFRGAVPPVVSFNLGSLGFLTAHHFADFQRDLRSIIHGNITTDGVYITLRMRLRSEIFRNGNPVPGKVFDVLNEVVVDRGSNPYLCKIECYERNHLITKVQADGVIVATPTGSTAYSTSAGGSMVHPNVPCMLFTPICPHSLSFRPVILPDSAQLELKIPDDARSNSWVSFDGKRRQQLSKGDSVRIYMSEHPLPTINKCDQTGDWFRSLVRCLNWNERMEQKGFTV